MPDASARMRAVARNPVAFAKFFHLIVTLFIKHILRWGTGTDGLLGPTAGYYGTVETQGRLTLHLHRLLWMKCSLTPQQIRDRVLQSPEFQQEMIEWLESCCTGELFSGPLKEVLGDLPSSSIASDSDPTMSLPESPPAID
ncbi:hypothetical protein QCA50_007964 [Cerrena zonata]|uniref:Helitron helicase-like domain-containing protein n=1 Tax=Cerrena zonata TaxID=2478898 RepID=A0AAW0G6H7_9APHY